MVSLERKNTKSKIESKTAIKENNLKLIPKCKLPNRPILIYMYNFIGYKTAIQWGMPCELKSVLALFFTGLQNFALSNAICVLKETCTKSLFLYFKYTFFLYQQSSNYLPNRLCYKNVFNNLGNAFISSLIHLLFKGTILENHVYQNSLTVILLLCLVHECIFWGWMTSAG